MKKILIIASLNFAVLMLFSFSLGAQSTIEFGYDDNGNRITRTVVSLNKVLQF